MNAASRILTSIRYAFSHRSNKLLLAVTAVSITAVLAVAFIYWMPAAMEHGSICAKIAGVKAEMHSINSARAVLEAFNKNLAAAGALELKLSSAKSAIDISAALNNLAKKTGMKLAIENSDSGKVNIPGYDINTQDISATGSYSGLRQFIYGLENSGIMAVLKKVKIENEGRDKVKSSIAIVTYRKPSGRAGEK